MGVVVACVATAVVVACTGEDVEHADAGAEGGACFANGTCNAGLVCTGGRCLVGDGGVSDDAGNGGGSDATVDSAPGDAGSDATTVPDGAVACDAAVPNVSESTVACPGTTCVARSETCCLGPDAGQGVCIQNGNVCPTGRPQMCLRAGQCSTGAQCCLTASNLVSNTCPPSGEIFQTECRSGENCDQRGDIELCAGIEPCHSPGTTCKIFAIGGPNPFPVGACLP